MKTCKEITRLVSEGQDRQLGRAERLAIRIHMLMCRGCSRFEKQITFLRVALRHLPGE
ncbi:MAG: zf-HC2 domain-containing protein [Propionivibrio sp.]